jgi:hypothetical protein
MLGSLRIFSKILGDICKSRCNNGVNVADGKFATGVNDAGGNGISDTGGKFVTGTAGVVDTGGKFATGVNDTGGN